MEQIPTRKLLFPLEVRNALQIILGLAFCVAGYKLYLIPNNIAAGGFTGIGQIVNALFGLPIGMVSIALNIPLFIVSMKTLGLTFGLRSLAATAALSVLLDVLPIGGITSDMLLATVFGGLMTGIGFGLIIRGNATTGGTDMLSSIIHRFIPVLNVGTGMTMIDGLIIIASAFVFDDTCAMYALICMFIMNTMVDFVLNGPNTANSFIIISNHNDRIRSAIINDMARGVTVLKGRGGYSEKDKEVLLCVINRFESMQLRRIISSIDPEAFVIVDRTHEVLGEGFNTLQK